MKKTFEITDAELIAETLNNAEYGVLALCGDKPYAVPVNFVYLEEAIYFHGSPKGKKMGIIKQNSCVSFNVTTDATIIPSYFSSKENIACPASTFYKSITLDGNAEIIDNRDEVAQVFAAMMGKLQPEGRYQSFDSSEYDKQFSALAVVKVRVNNISAKFKFGQNLNRERFNMVVRNLEERGTRLDILTAEAMKRLYLR